VTPLDGAMVGRYVCSVTDTSTIRVPRETRDLLAGIAREHGVSVSALLTEFARRTMRDESFRSEREATLADASNPEAVAEMLLWESTLEDGLD
jgi:hypothetical protein